MRNKVKVSANLYKRKMLSYNSDPNIKDPELQPAKEEKKKPHARFTERRSLSFIFTKNYGIMLLMVLILIGNTIARGFNRQYSFIAFNLLFLVLYFIVACLFNPLNFASDDKNYQLPKFNLAYSIANRRLAPPFLSRMGKHLELHPQGSLLANFLIVAISAIISILWYGHNFEILGFPLLILFVLRMIAANNFKSLSKLVTLLKWILFMLFLVQQVTSIFWIVPTDYSLWCYISIYNALGIWMRNMNISMTRNY